MIGDAAALGGGRGEDVGAASVGLGSGSSDDDKRALSSQRSHRLSASGARRSWFSEQCWIIAQLVDCSGRCGSEPWIARAGLGRMRNCARAYVGRTVRSRGGKRRKKCDEREDLLWDGHGVALLCMYLMDQQGRKNQRKGGNAMSQDRRNKFECTTFSSLSSLFFFRL